MLVNFWKSRKPLEPACIEPGLSLYYTIEHWMYYGMQWITNSSQDSQVITYDNHKPLQLTPILIPSSELTNKHRLDLQIGQHESVGITVPLPENSKAPGNE